MGPQDSSGGPSLRAAHTYLELSLSTCRQWTWEVSLCLGLYYCIHKIEPSEAPTYCEAEERTQLRLASGFAITLRPTALKMWSMEEKFLQCISNPWIIITFSGVRLPSHPHDLQGIHMQVEEAPLVGDSVHLLWSRDLPLPFPLRAN